MSLTSLKMTIFVRFFFSKKQKAQEKKTHHSSMSAIKATFSVGVGFNEALCEDSIRSSLSFLSQFSGASEVPYEKKYY